MKNQSKIKSFKLEQTEWVDQLRQNGCVVIADILNPQQIQKAKDLYWDWLEALGSGISRSDSETWNDNNWPCSSNMGYLVSYGGCHTHASWYLRTHPKVKAAFASIWKTQSLIVSFDTMICWRPWWNKVASKYWYPYVQNLHVDQNPCFKKGFHCVQGMIPLLDVSSKGVGGLQVVTGVNNDETQQELADRYPSTKLNNSDWLELRGDDPYMGQGQLVECKAGSLILFDSRTIHGGMICNPNEEFKIDNVNQLVRLALTVTMVSKYLQSQLNRQRRLNAFKDRIGLTHWPQEFNKSGFGSYTPNIVTSKIKYEWPILTPEIDDLI